MENQISIVNTEQEISLETNKEDVMSLFVKSIFGIVPLGSSIAEIITAIIPHQKLERLIDFVKVLNYKFKNAERKIEEHELKTAELTDLLEDGLLQASRALTDERLEYIASLLINSLTDEDLEHIEKKELLKLLNQLNDAEIIWLKSYTFPIRSFQSSFKEFYEKHENILEEIGITRSSSEEMLDKKALQKRYKNNLLNLGLIELSKIKASQYKCSRLGKLLLRFIDLENSEEG